MIVLANIAIGIIIAFCFLMILVTILDDGDIFEDDRLRVLTGFIAVIIIMVIIAIMFYNFGSGNEIGIIPLK